MRIKKLNSTKRRVFIKQQMLLFVHLMTFSFLSGCSTTSEVFDCEAGKGIGCKSISEVNRLVEQGQAGGNSDEPQSQKMVAPVFAQNKLNSGVMPIDGNEIVCTSSDKV